MNSPWHLPRIPEPEEMDCSDEVEVYNSAAASAHLDAIDNTFVEHLMRLLPESEPRPPGRGHARDTGMIGNRAPSLAVGALRDQVRKSQYLGLDIGCGPAQIPVKTLQRVPGLRLVGLDGAGNMLRCARANAVQAGVEDRLILAQGDAKNLPFADGTFSIVTCNSMLHHARDPLALLREIRRVAAPGAAILLRDLRRPAYPLQAWHLWRHGRKYSGLMRRLFDLSVQAAYTADELEAMLRAVPIPGARVFRYKGAHIGIERRGN
ncbi:MAG: class I SAM-dependent methyltransferase [Acidobacteria bacterium]|nr:class I SAM-dependent methyltransferase [Acidobacteriota bacterium]